MIHDKGNEENLFDRVDYQLSSADSIHLNFGYSRSWFQTPNSLDAQSATPWNGLDGVLPAVENYGGVVPIGNPTGFTQELPLDRMTNAPKSEPLTLPRHGPTC